MSEYIGKRVIPRHEGLWDRNQNYEPLCLVLAENGDSYISRRAVPAGIDLSNENYWSLCQRFSAQVEDMGHHVDEKVAQMVHENRSTVTSVNETCENTINTVNETCENTVNSVTEQTTAVIDDTHTIQTELESRMERIEARQEANVTAHTDANADFAAEVVDARVDACEKTCTSLGDNIRGIHRGTNTVSDLLASMTYENVLATDGSLEIIKGTFYNSEGGSREWAEFDAVKIPCKQGDRFFSNLNVSKALYKGNTCLGYIRHEKINGGYYFTIDQDADYFWFPLSVNSYGRGMCIRGSYLPGYFIEPGKVYTLMENSSFLPRRGTLPAGNLNDIKENCIYLLTSGNVYENMASGADAGFLFTLFDDYRARTGAQIFYTFTTGNILYRSKLSGEWREWRYAALQKSDIETLISNSGKKLMREMRAFGIHDLLHENAKMPTGTGHGVTYTANPDGSVTVHGIATQSSFINILDNRTVIPNWLEKGKDYVLRINDPTKTVSLEVFYFGNEDAWKLVASTFSCTTFRIPDDANGLLIRLRSTTGTDEELTVYPTISEKFTAEEYYDMHRSDFDRISDKANQIASYRQYDFNACERLENGYKSSRNEWVENENFDMCFIPITNNDRYFFTRTNTSLYFADKDKNILSGSYKTKSQTCSVDGWGSTISYCCHEMDRPDNAVYLAAIISKQVNYYLRSSSENRFLPMFDNGVNRNESKAYETIFLGDTLLTPNPDAEPGTFYENVVQVLGQGDLYPNNGYYCTGTLFIKKGTIIDVSNTNLRLNIRGFTAQGLFYRESLTHFEFPVDFVGSIDYHVGGSWKWTSDDPGMSVKDESFFVRVITPEEQRKNPWKGKIWYSYGTSITDIGIGDEIGNNGHSGKWPLYLDAVSGMERHNGAIGSGGIREGASHGGNVKAKLLTTPHDCDLVTLEVIPNDAPSTTNTGNITDTDGTTICGAFKQCCEYITKHTRARFVVLFVITSTSNRNDSYKPYDPTSSGHIAYRDCVDKLTKIAEYYGVDVIDAEKECANWWHKQKGILVRDQIHLNYLGGEVFGKYIWKKLLELDPYPVFEEITG